MSFEPGAAQLYDDAIKLAAREACGAGRLCQLHAEATVDNPLCGDRVTLGVLMAGQAVASVGHRVRGCLLCEAAASVIGAVAPGEDVDSVRRALGSLDALMGGEPPGFETTWERLEIFAPVRDFKSRHRCVRLPFEALVTALENVEACDREQD